MTWPIVFLVCGASVIAALRRRDAATLTGRRGTVVALAIIAALTVAIPWLTSQVSPTWATRYLIAALAPTLLICAAAIASVGRLGLAALAAIAIIWTATPAPRQRATCAMLPRPSAPTCALAI